MYGTLPEQFFLEDKRRYLELIPEKRLLLGLLICNLTDLRDGRGHKDPELRMLGVAAVRWFKSVEVTYPQFSFEDVCTHLNLDTEYIRNLALTGDLSFLERLNSEW